MHLYLKIIMYYPYESDFILFEPECLRVTSLLVFRHIQLVFMINWGLYSLQTKRVC